VRSQMTKKKYLTKSKLEKAAEAIDAILICDDPLGVISPFAMASLITAKKDIREISDILYGEG
jgi:hypothetical protein